MIHRLIIENLYSFKDRTEIDFTVPQNAGQEDIYATEPDGSRLNLITAIFGPNASGKTNLLKALGFLHWFICASADRKPGEAILGAECFAFSQPIERGCDLALQFSFDGRLYWYRVRTTGTRVLEESLHVKKTRFNYIFERSWDEKNKQYSSKFQDFGDHARLPLRENASVISTAVLQENPLAMALTKYFNSFYGNIGVFGRTAGLDPHAGMIYFAAGYFEENPEIFGALKSHLRAADLGLSEIKLARLSLLSKEGKEDHITAPIVVHEVGGKKFDMPLIRESRGTEALFVLLRYILPVLKSGGVAYIDELESSLHSHLIREIVRMFYSRRTNPKHAQLIFTCHSDYLLTELRKYQIVLVEKDADCVSHAWRLDEMQGVRASENILAKYHAGAYGALPDL
jgi:putative AbiEii toxin of type IV toxin-antitoxin system